MLVFLTVGVVTAADGKLTIGEGVDLTISGDVNIDYAQIDGNLLELQSRLATASTTFKLNKDTTQVRVSNAPRINSIDLFTGRFTLRGDLSWGDRVSGRVEFETKSIADGGAALGTAADDWNRIGADGADKDLEVEQAYIDIKQVVTDFITLRLGMQDVRYKNTVHEDPFFMDLTESESAWSGASSDGYRLTNSVNRTTLEPVGILARLAMAEQPWTLDLFYFTVSENIAGGTGEAKQDERIAGAVFSYDLAGIVAALDALKAGIMLVQFGGGTASPSATARQGGQNVRTWGLNFDLMAMEKQIEVFGEFYTQSGTVFEDTSARGDLDQSGQAFQFGARYVPAMENLKNYWAELKYSKISGDENPADSDNEQFMSYENVDDFIVMESNDFGLDWDANYKAWKLKVGANDIAALGEFGKISATLKYGMFKTDETVYTIDATGAGGTLAGTTNQFAAIGSGDKLGNEFDLNVELSHSKNVRFYWTYGLLMGSDALDDATPSSESKTWVAVIGTKLSW